MAAQLIAVDASALDALVSEVRELRNEVRQARIQPEPKWITIAECALKSGKSQSTVSRWAREGKLPRKDGLVLNPAF